MKKNVYRLTPFANSQSVLLVVAAALLTFLFVNVAPAFATFYPQVANFAGNPGEVKDHSSEFPEEVQLGGASSMAVNYTGAGGVPAGTLYAANNEPFQVVRYNPDGSFSEAWNVQSVAPIPSEPKERCGPDGDAAYPHCPSRSGGQIRSGEAVGVDQTSGNVYRLTSGGLVSDPNSHANAVIVYSADGSNVITSFAERIHSYASETIANSPGKIHTPEGIAVGAGGVVYVADNDTAGGHRIAVFKPQSPGDYEHYVYAGQASDIGDGTFMSRPAIDEAGDIYTAVYDTIRKWDPSNPTNPPVCEFKFKPAQIQGLAVNPKSGEVFFYSRTTLKLHQLSPCNAEGKFEEVASYKPTPTRFHIYAMTIDPVREYGPGRPPGVLYAGAGDGEGGNDGFRESAMGYIFGPPVELPPEVLSESVSAIAFTTARLEAMLNPRGIPTNYTFQYLSDSAYQENEPAERFAGAAEVPLGEGKVEGAVPIAVAAAVSGLAPDTTYRYRIIAHSNCSAGEPKKACPAAGPAQAFTTYATQSAVLPDSRAYELVSPAEKNGGQVMPGEPEASSCPTECKPGFAYRRFPMQSALDGGAVVYEGTPFSFDEGALIENQYVSHRSASGWRTVNLTPTRMGSKGGGGYQLFKADLSEGVLEQQDHPLGDLGPPEYPNLYTQTSADPGLLTPLVTEEPPNRLPFAFQTKFAGASADFSRLFFSANDALTPEAEGGSEAKANLYESSGGELQLVNFAPGNASTLPGAVFGSGRLLQHGVSGAIETFVFHAISEDGSRAFWTSEQDGHLYVRENGETLEVPDPGSCAVSLEASKRTCFWTASGDGSSVLLSDGLLFNVENLAEPPVDLTQGKGGFQGVLGQSEDLSRIYFADTKVLSGEEENKQGAKAQEGKANLYAWHEGVTTFIAAMSAGGEIDSENWRFAPARRSASASPDGRWLAFVSEASLTGFDNTGPCVRESFQSENFKSAPCKEVFLYQAETGELHCPSCNRTGAPPRGPAHLLQLTNGGATLPRARYLTDSGRLVFDSQDSLSPFDTNGRVEDVYEFEPNGVGDCTAKADCVRLVSAGRSGIDSNFLTMDPSGKNIFFTSRDQLVTADKDDLVDLYDAREGGGFPPEAPPAECQGEACLPSVSPPNDPTPSSAGFRGPGNQASAEGAKRCSKGRHAVKRKGKSRCVKRNAKRRHNRANSNRGGAK
jgi:hypothetical protein